MGQVLGEILAGQPREMMAHDDALGERFVDGHGEASPELGEADKEKAQSVL